MPKTIINRPKPIQTHRNTATDPTPRNARFNATATRSTNNTRFGNPVNRSCNASCANLNSDRFRSTAYRTARANNSESVPRFGK